MLGGLPDCTVALDTDRLPAAVLSDAREGCARLGVRTVEWRSGQESPPRSDALVSGLRWGERAVPGELLTAFEGTARRSPLLLACAEPLVEPSLTLHGGLVTLFQAPSSPGRLFSELRMALARRSLDPRTAPDAASPITRELCDAHTWCAALQSPGSRAAPLLREEERGLCTLLPLEPGLSGGEQLLAEAAAALHEGAGAEAGQQLQDRLGARAGLVALLGEPREWLIYWPSATAPLWFSSPHRLPRLVDYTRGPKAPGAGLQRVAAAGGDLLVAVSTPVPASFPLPSVGATAGADGAPAWLLRALPALQSLAGPWGLLAVEVRA